MHAVHLTFFESLLLLLVTAIALMQVSRRTVALKRLAEESAAADSGVRRMFELARDAWAADGTSAERQQRKKLIRAAIDAQRAALGKLQAEYQISEETFLTLQQELDWRQLSLYTADAQAIEET